MRNANAWLPADVPKLPFVGRTLLAGALVVLRDLFFALSSAAYILPGELSPFIPVVVVATVVCLIIPNLLIAFAGSNPTTVCGVHAGLMPVTAALVAGITANLATGGHASQLLPTLVFGICVATVFTGVVLYTLGHFRLGDLIRYIPYPVVGGFFAGVGYLLLAGGLEMMTGIPLSLRDPAPWLERRVLGLWLPGLVFGIALYAMQRYRDHWLLFPGFITAAVALFYGYLQLRGISPEEARVARLLLEIEVGSVFWPQMSLSDLADVNVAAVLGQYQTLAAMAIIGAISMLINASGIEIASRQDLDLNRDLKVTGFANIITGLSGGLVGLHRAIDTVFNLGLGVNTRLAPLAYAAFGILVLYFGLGIFMFMPIPILGGLLVYYGCLFMGKALLDDFKRLSFADRCLVLIVTVVMATLGLLPGIGVGLAFAILLFTYRYSLINVIRFSISGNEMETNVERPREHRLMLEQEGRRIHVYVLEGFLFFGSAHKLLESVHSRITDAVQLPLTHLILDFRLVSQIDSSVAFSFSKLKILAEEHAFTIVLTDLSPDIERSFEAFGFYSGNAASVRRFAEFSQGGSWCEEQVLASAGAKPVSELDLDTLLQQIIPQAVDRKVVSSYFERFDYDADHTLFQQGMSGDGLYLIGAGRVVLSAKLTDQTCKRLRTLAPGSMFGEMALYTTGLRSATARMEQPGVVYRLSLKHWQQLSTQHPQRAAALHFFVVHMLSGRLARTNTRLLHALSLGSNQPASC